MLLSTPWSWICLHGVGDRFLGLGAMQLGHDQVALGLGLGDLGFQLGQGVAQVRHLVMLRLPLGAEAVRQRLGGALAGQGFAGQVVIIGCTASSALCCQSSAWVCACW